MKEYAQEGALIAVAYLVAYLLTFYLVMPIQNLVIGGAYTELASLVFLPHGVRVLSIFLLGARAIPMLLIASTILVLIFEYPGAYFTGTSGALCAYLAFKIFQLAGYRIEPRSQLVSQWRSLMLIALVAAVINGLSIPLILVMGGFSEGEVTPLILLYVIGDTLGAFVFFALLAAGGRAYRWVQGRQSVS